MSMAPKDWEQIINPIKSFISSLIGGTADTGGSVTAGTLMAKENAALEAISKLLKNVNRYPRYVPSNTVRETLYSNSFTCTARGCVLYSMVAEHDGAICVRLFARQKSGGYTGHIYAITESIFSASIYNHTDEECIMSVDVLNSPSGTEGEFMLSTEFSAAINHTEAEYEFIIPVKKGEKAAVCFCTTYSSDDASCIVRNLRVMYDIDEGA